MVEIVKTCTCCGRTFSEAEWLFLTYVGVQEGIDCSFELRNCRCGSTLARKIDAAHPE